MTDLSDIRRRMHDLTMAYGRRERDDPEKWAALFEKLSIEARQAGLAEDDTVGFEAFERKHIIVQPSASHFRAWEQPYKG
ncbi:hypothetical protein [Brevundimonas sp.]|uniref:hypothetical protein n=1 Tax=Brevundimonas sp. TaxID=1871086 RepID=UPI00289724CB|nr:hypothetical protein [Brevundimonas sp.]